VGNLKHNKDAGPSAFSAWNSRERKYADALWASEAQKKRLKNILFFNRLLLEEAPKVALLDPAFDFFIHCRMTPITRARNDMHNHTLTNFGYFIPVSRSALME
jgi:hypothetical protein